jgi:molecular chaperone GrpE
MGKHTTSSQTEGRDEDKFAEGAAASGGPGGAPADLESRLRELEAERDEAVAGRKRALADFQNFQRRSYENERRALITGSARAISSILPVLDHIELALAHKPEDLTVEQLIGAVKILRDELSKALQTNGVSRIEPARGDEFNPNLQEAMMRRHEPDIPPNGVVAVLQPGYMMDEQHILRPAKVILAAEADAAEESRNADV